MSSVEIETLLLQINGVQEVAAIEVPPAGGGPGRLVIYVVEEDGVTETEARPQLKQAMQQVIKSQLNPLFRIHAVVRCESLPRTASNKIMRRTLRSTFLLREQNPTGDPT